MIQTQARSSLPRGRFLYRLSDTTPYVVVRHERRGELWIVEEGWSAESEAAGPFAAEDALRAQRLANTSVPEGCELGPWQPGIGLFDRAGLPGHPNDWSRFDPTWLPPAIALYTDTDLDEVINETCCAPPRDVPRLGVHGKPQPDVSELDVLIQERHPELHLQCVGVLARPWNAHPEGSPVFARSAELSGHFVVIDLPD